MINISELRNKLSELIEKMDIDLQEEEMKKIKEELDVLIENATKPDKTDLSKMSNSKVFFTLLLLMNNEKYSYEEIFKAVEENKEKIDAWTSEKNLTLLTLYNKTNEGGDFTLPECLQYFMHLDLSPVFLNYNMKNTYFGISEFIRLKEAINTINKNYGKARFKDKVLAMKNTYKDNAFCKYIETAKMYISEILEEISKKKVRINEIVKNANEVLQLLENPQEITIIPDRWFKTLTVDILDDLYELASYNNQKKYEELCKKEENLSKKINKTELRSFIYSNGFDPNSLSPVKLEFLERIPQITYHINFLMCLGITLNNILTKYYSCLISLTDEKIALANELIKQGAITSELIKENISVLDKNYLKIKTNYEILKDVIDWNNVFYNDSILLKDSKVIKDILTVLKEYKLSKNNYIFLLCNYEYINIYDLLLEHDIPTSLFISICKTQNPYNTIKRILVYINIGEPYVSGNNELRKDITNPTKFICEDSSLDEYLPNYIEASGLNIVFGTSINEVKESPIVKNLEENYRIDDVYVIGNINISRAKFLRNFESVSTVPNLLIASLVSGSILTEEEFVSLLNTLREKQIKK